MWSQWRWMFLKICQCRHLRVIFNKSVNKPLLGVKWKLLVSHYPVYFHSFVGVHVNELHLWPPILVTPYPESNFVCKYTSLAPTLLLSVLKYWQPLPLWLEWFMLGQHNINNQFISNFLILVDCYASMIAPLFIMFVKVIQPTDN